MDAEEGHKEPRFFGGAFFESDQEYKMMWMMRHRSQYLWDMCADVVPTPEGMRILFTHNHVQYQVIARICLPPPPAKGALPAPITRMKVTFATPTGELRRVLTWKYNKGKHAFAWTDRGVPTEILDAASKHLCRVLTDPWQLLALAIQMANSCIQTHYRIRTLACAVQTARGVEAPAFPGLLWSPWDEMALKASRVKQWRRRPLVEEDGQDQ